MILGDDLEVGVVAERYGRLRGEIVGHRLEQGLGFRLVGACRRSQPIARTSATADTRALPASDLHVEDRMLVFMLVTFRLVAPG